ncbi:MAG: FMN-binding glutamate synthase family protein [Candidatus Nealsonbacteria bacterium CG11_big_fil_rev_8_21_14_0_20_35_11]|uniref:FMN-binding glutamate synthase family protein n=1 Tax=Candidatus Nealsonbacteria bacterium CG11_big_fil_rev_8_21_14_0_20_35_11 TaxID=1974713 RepID=A0A2H0N151_9BACT|nr:MAG: FMN-binding glutamate synthase family protein [Candidatus Nealsonbacteria bacterium CG11_big_fil_rev_8_21_14_0_20_35_11]
MDQNWIKEIQKRVKGVPISSGRGNKFGKISFDDLVFVPAQLAKKPVDYFKEEISSKTVIGKRSKKQIELETPIIIGAISFGAVSREAKIALAKTSTLAGTIENTGEGGMLPEEREFSKYLIIQYSTGRFGITEEILKKADAIEIKIGQGAKPGMGGLLPAEKVTEEIAKIRNVQIGKDIHSPAYHPDIKNIEDLRKKINWLRDLTGGVPIIIKLAAGDVENDVKLAVKANPDIIAIDGIEGGTGAAPEVMLDEVGIPTLAALVKARKVLDRIGAKQELWIGGGLRKGGDFAKALALGADAVFVATSLLAAMGCTYCRLCYLGKCPKGITTQDPNLRKNLNVEEAAQKVASYIKNCTEEIKMIAGACGENDIHRLNKSHLRGLNPDIVEITKVKLI